MSPLAHAPTVTAPSFPRVSGDEPARAFLSVGQELFSPRERESYGWFSCFPRVSGDEPFTRGPPH